MSKPLVADIVKYLGDCLANGSVSSDDKESIEVAIDAISEVFGVEAGSGDLAEIYAKGVQSAAGSAAEGAGSFATPNTGSATPTSAPTEATPEQKAEAEAKKVEGNREMAHKNYDAAIELYTEAIALDSSNKLYYSNRAAAYSQVNNPTAAVNDARRAISLDPSFSKAYGRLGLALYTLGDIQGSLDAYEHGLKAEGDAPSEGMRRGLETVKARLEAQDSQLSEREASSGSATGASGTPNEEFGAANNLGLGSLGDLLKNPEVRNMASKMMSNPSAMSDLMNSPMAQSLKSQFGGGLGGGMPDIGKLMSDPNMAKMMNDPMLQSMAKQFMGGSS